MRRNLNACSLALALCLSNPLSAAVIHVEVEKPGAKINPAMWGIFFEDINFGADGGLYAELVKNRSFEFPDHLMGWSKLSPSLSHGRLSIRDDAPFNTPNPHYLRIESEGPVAFGIANEGFHGMGVRQGDSYNFSAQIRKGEGSASLRIELYSSDGTRLDSQKLEDFSTSWKRYSVVLHPSDSDAKARLYLLLDGNGSLDLDMVSLFPQKTWKNRPEGLRADMVQMLADLKPGFMRFPGGCIVEGSDLSKRYQWKKTIGPVEERPLLINRWNYEFLHRPAPDYFQSFGLGFLEFFQLCEDIGAQPLPILNCGMACQFNSSELCPLNQLDPFIQDALDLIEFANGPVSSSWGAKRAQLGHPATFNLKMMGVGNEQWGPQYVERFEKFANAIKQKHPEISLVAASGPDPGDERFQFLWSKFRAVKADIIDEHCYSQPSWFLANSHRYDNYDRNGPKVFMGEYAAQSVATLSTKNHNNLQTAIAEAAYLTGLERNADVVRMASYAPLFAHEEGWQWKPDLIWVNNLSVLATPNYYVQQAFARNHGDVVLPTRITDQSVAKPGNLPTMFASATREDRGDVILKLVNSAQVPDQADIELDTSASINGSASAVVLTGPDAGSENTFEKPNTVAPVTSTVSITSKAFRQTLAPNSLTVLRLKLKEIEHLTPQFTGSYIPSLRCLRLRLRFKAEEL